MLRLTNITDNTARGYIRSAGDWLKTEIHKEVPLFTNKGGTKKQEQLDPYLRELLAQRAVHSAPKGQKEPMTSAMLATMEIMAAEASRSRYGIFSRDAVLYDFTRVGVYTGSRVGEYGIGRAPRGTPPDGWIPIPDSRDVPAEWRGRPIVFLPEDFELFNEQYVSVDHCQSMRTPQDAVFVHVRFRYDKSTKNFVYRKFRRVDGRLCIVKAVLSILRRHYSSPRDKYGRDTPLGMFIGANGRQYSIRGSHMQDFMQRACKRAYPNPKHYLRMNIDRLMSHSMRVTAAVLLYNAGVPIDVIAFRLRWSSDAVKLYIREAASMTATLSESAFAGAFCDE